MAHSTDTSARNKDRAKKIDLPKHSPFFIHRLGYFAKKIMGQTKYFGRVEDGHDAALKDFVAKKDSLYAGVTVVGEQMKLSELVNRFLTTKHEKCAVGELKQRTFKELKKTCETLLSVLKKATPISTIGPPAFAKVRKKLAQRNGPVRLGNEIQRVRGVFTFAYKEGHITNPAQFGVAFAKPSRATIRKAKRANGPRMFSPDEIRTLLDNASDQLLAMILLGVNAGFGNEDCARLPINAVDLESGWVSFDRPKTGIQRRAKLWSETVDAIRKVMESRPAPTSRVNRGLLFITTFGGAWSHDVFGTSAIGHEFAKLMKRCKIERPGVGFYGLRHSFRTAADGCKDQPAIDMVMGHETEGTAKTYREMIDDERLEAVGAHVRQWFLAKPKAKRPAPATEGGAA